MFTAKERVCITSDGTAVKANDPKAATLLASEGTELHAKQLANIKGWKKFFKGTNLDDVEEKESEGTEESSTIKKRVAPEAAPAKAPTVHIKK